ncbi:DUF4383 domain-containing protein [Fischerella sp. PCC 9605]|uniref:DUF4383 domain-containing protein n=1 Tax=Fischerella sp. PCC 9605 TaxID=1173024 RepID=UPI0004B93878|nr:DUF4383 domain-containing protein [Fischerella sp. PCC 9605]
MRIRYFALVVGIFFLLVGILGFVPGLLSLPKSAPAIQVNTGYGYLFGIFPINYLHNVVHLVVGVLGIAAFWSFKFARLYAQGLAIFYGLLAVMGLIPATNTTFGLIPIFGNNVWLHALTALIAAYFGYFVQVSPEEAAKIDAKTV